jgi:hypothetical protein
MARALVLTAGGITGALYEVGVLRAVEERYGSPLDLFDLFVGISAGASVAAFLAQGVSPTRLYEALLDGGDPLFPLEQRHVAALDLRRALRLAENERGPCIVAGEDGQCLSLRERGLWAIHDQAARIEHQERLHLGIARFELEHPAARVALVEPERSDATLFLANPMGLAARREVLEGGFSRGRAALTLFITTE